MTVIYLPRSLKSKEFLLFLLGRVFALALKTLCTIQTDGLHFDILFIRCDLVIVACTSSFLSLMRRSEGFPVTVSKSINLVLHGVFMEKYRMILQIRII